MSATDWKTARVVRDGKGRLRTGDGRICAWSVGEGLSEEAAAAYERALGGLTPVLDADVLPVVRTVGDLTARHIGRRVRWDDGDEGVLDSLGAERCRFECLADLDGRENPRTYGAWLPLDTPCEVLP